MYCIVFHLPNQLSQQMIIINTQSFVDSPIDKPVEDAEAATAGSPQ